MGNRQNLVCYFCGSATKQYLSFNTIDIISCVKCKIAFTFPVPTLPEYEELDFHNCTKSLDTPSLTKLNELPYNWKKLINIQTELLRRNLAESSKILEIGCGEGILLEALQAVGFKTFGIEPSKTAASRAKTRGLDVINGYFPDNNVNEKVDAVIMSHVLEHIQDPAQIINAIKLIAPGGYLVLTQTNYRGLIPRSQKGDWYAWVPEQHFWHFSLEGLTMWLNEFGFEQVEFKYSSLVHPENILYKASLLRNSWIDQYTVIYKLLHDHN